jgi:hypothetical protein
VNLKFTDHTSETIREISDKLFDEASGDAQTYSRLAFYWTRDRLKYVLGLDSSSACETIRKGYGSCSNKSNVLVCLLRAKRQEAGFRIYRVKAQHYFGPLAPYRITRFYGAESLHVAVCWNREGQWVDIDPTDDLPISEGGQHLNPPAKEVVFDGVNPAKLNIDSEHILEASEVEHNIDHIFLKKSKAPQFILSISNGFLDFVRMSGFRYTNIPELHEDYFAWLRVEYAEEYESFCRFEEEYSKAQEISGSTAQG